MFSLDLRELFKATTFVLHMAGADLVPNSTPVLGPDKFLYGTAAGGAGAVYTDGSAGFQVLYDRDFIGGNFVGYHPQGVFVDPSRRIYGTAFDGGAGGVGTVFQLIARGRGKVLHAFTGPDGAYPLVGPIIDPSGTLYGTTWEGGNPSACPNSPGCGTIWKLAPSSKEKVLHSFAFFTHKGDGMTPMSPLLRDDTTGALYGTTFNGGTGTQCGGVGGSCGTVFQVDASGAYGVLWEFPKGGPAAPQGQLALHAGEVYGTSYDGGKPCPDQHYIGCGTVWKLTP